MGSRRPARSQGKDPVTSRALRRDLASTSAAFPDDVQELQAYFEPAQPGQLVRAVPGEGTRVPIWLLGSSLYSAQLAAALGLPFAFASHFAPDLLMQALHLYREHFQASDVLEAPYAMAALNVFAAETDDEARRLSTSMQQQFVALHRRQPTRLQPPVESMEGIWTPAERAHAEHLMSYSVVGAPEAVRTGLAAFIERTRADELMITGHIFDHQARIRSFEIVAEARAELAG